MKLNKQTLPAIEQVTNRMPGGFFIYLADGDESLISAFPNTLETRSDPLHEEGKGSVFSIQSRLAGENGKKA